MTRDTDTIREHLHDLDLATRLDSLTLPTATTHLPGTETGVDLAALAASAQSTAALLSDELRRNQ